MVVDPSAARAAFALMGHSPARAGGAIKPEALGTPELRAPVLASDGAFFPGGL